MKNKKEDTVMSYYLSKNGLRTVCLKKCLDLKNGSDYISDSETDCLKNCDVRIRTFLNAALDVYTRDLKEMEN